MPLLRSLLARLAQPGAQAARRKQQPAQQEQPTREVIGAQDVRRYAGGHQQHAGDLHQFQCHGAMLALNTGTAQDRADLHNAMQDTLAMAREVQANLAVRECASMVPDWNGRALLWSLKARADELRAQITAAREVAA